MKQHIIPSPLLLVVFAAFMLLAPALARAQVAHTTVELGSNGALVFSVNGIALHVVGGAKVASSSVSSSDLTLVLAPPTQVVIKAPNLNMMTVARSSGATDYTASTVCNGTLSQVDISTGTATTTVTITPDSAVCTTNNGSGGGGSDSGSGGG